VFGGLAAGEGKDDADGESGGRKECFHWIYGLLLWLCTSP
jgi:hypothetical protein